MLTCYFGVPGSGKTSLLTKFARKELKRIKRGKSPYDFVCTNFYCKGCKKIDYDDLATYKVTNSLILLDEITLDADNRDFKNFSNAHRDFFILHRHVANDIIYATQAYDMVDKKVRVLTQELWYMTKSVVPLISEFTTAKRIYRTISINEHTSELIMGYRFCKFLEAIFTSNVKICFRRPYYKYFDSFDEGNLSDRPSFLYIDWDNFINAHKEGSELPDPDVIADGEPIFDFNCESDEEPEAIFDDDIISKLTRPPPPPILRLEK